MGCLNLGADHARSNVKLMAELQKRAPPNVITVLGFCKQHASGLAISAVIRYLGIMCPTFCVAKLFRRDGFYRQFKEGVRQAVGKRLTWVRAALSPFWRPQESHQDHAREMLELAYYHRDLRTCADAAEGEKLRAQDSLRRFRGAQLLEACPGDWRRVRIAAPCFGAR